VDEDAGWLARRVYRELPNQNQINQRTKGCNGAGEEALLAMVAQSRPPAEPGRSPSLMETNLEVVPFIVYYNGMATGPCIKRCVDFLMEDGPQTFGNAVERIDLYPRCQTRDQITPDLDFLLVRFQIGLKSLPFIRFRRKTRLFEVSYVSSWVHSSEMFGKSIVDLPKPEFHCLCLEFANALLLLRKRLKKTDDFDMNAFETQLQTRIDTINTPTTT
jgi:hypothetical protein